MKSFQNHFMLLGIIIVWFVLSARAYTGREKQQVLLTANNEYQEEMICPADSIECYPLHFKPEQAFQPILPHQIIPPGLHYRINIETGLKEAKLLSPYSDDDSDGSPSSANDLAIISSNSSSATAQIPNELRDIITQLAQSTSPDESLAILGLLDDADIGGLEEGEQVMNVGADLFRKLLDDATGEVEERVKMKVGGVVGQACQNNPKAQSHARHSGLLVSLLAELSSASTARETELASKYLYALGAVIRSNSNNVASLYDVGGLSVLALVVDGFRDSYGHKHIVGRVEQLAWDIMDDGYYKDGEKVPVPEERQMGLWCDVLTSLAGISRDVDTVDDMTINWTTRCSSI